MNEQYKYNVAVIGKTGAGKSAFINYLYGDKICKTGAGKPITEKGFHATETKIKGLPVIVFDSWGLEADKWEEWSAYLDEELKKRSADKPVRDWFHSVFYCIQAGGARIEPADEKIIQKLLEQHYKISIILTKADQLDEDDEEKFIHVIKKSFPSVSVLPVCSEGKKTRGGETKPFGKEQVEMKAYANFFDSLIMRLPILCKSTLHKMRDECFREARDYVSDIGIFGFGCDDGEIRNKLSNKFNKLPADLLKNNKKIVTDALEMIQDFTLNLGYSPSIGCIQNEIYYFHFYEMPRITTYQPKINLIPPSSTLEAVLILLCEKYKMAQDAKQELSTIIGMEETQINCYIRNLILDVELYLKRVKSQQLIAYNK